METVKCGKIKIIVLILSALFLIGGCIFGQEMSIERVVGYNGYYKKNIVKKYPSYNLEFIDGKDTISMSVFSDSISSNRYGVRLYVYYPKTTDLNNSIVKLSFADGSYDYVTSFETDHNLSYVEYALPQNLFVKMLTAKVKSVQFNLRDKVDNITDDTYFIAFFNRVD